MCLVQFIVLMGFSFYLILRHTDRQTDRHTHILRVCTICRHTIIIGLIKIRCSLLVNIYYHMNYHICSHWWCRSHAFCFVAVLVEITGRETVGQWVQFNVNIMQVYRQDKRKEKLWRGESTIWVKMENLICKCPKIRLHRKYLVIGRDSGRRKKDGLRLDRKTIVIPWRDDWERRLRQFRKYQRQGGCHWFNLDTSYTKSEAAMLRDKRELICIIDISHKKLLNTVMNVT